MKTITLTDREHHTLINCLMVASDIYRHDAARSPIPDVMLIFAEYASDALQLAETLENAID